VLSCDAAIIERVFYVKPLTSQIKSMADKSKTKKWKSEDKSLKEQWTQMYCCVENKGLITCTDL
jgi:hypothetical protein